MIQLDYLNSRELATTIWLCVLLILSGRDRRVRDALRNLVSATFEWKIVVAVAIYGAYFAVWVWIAGRSGLWDPTILKDTIIWCVFSGLPIVTAFDKIGTDEHYLRHFLRRIAEVSALVAFFMNVLTFGLLAELIIQPGLAFLVLGIALSEHDQKLRDSKRVFETVFGIAVFVLVVLTIRNVYLNYEEIDTSQLWRSLLATVWLPVVALPFAYAFSLVVSYELAFMRIGFDRLGTRHRIRAKVAVLVGLSFRDRDIHQFVGSWPNRVAEETTFRLSLDRVKDYRRSLILAAEEDEQKIVRLIRFAGVNGTDAEGRRLDQRDFEQTCNALDWLATCEMGWFNRDPIGYKDNLLEVLGDFSRYELPDEHGIKLCVRSDRMAWYAWRRTVSNWVFAIGASKEPPDKWLYDGPIPPTGFPASDPKWDGNADPNW